MDETDMQFNETSIEYLERVLLDLPTSIFVESRAAQAAGAAINLKVDYDLFLRYIQESCQLVHAKYYWSLGLREDDVGASKFLKYLGHVGWDAWSSEANQSRSDFGQPANAPPIARFNPKVKLTVDALTATQHSVQQVILFVRGSDYMPLIVALQARGIRVVCIGWTDRHQGADSLIDLRRLSGDIGTYREGGL